MSNFHHQNHSPLPSGQDVYGGDGWYNRHGIPQPLLPLKKRAYKLVLPQLVGYRGRGRPKYRYRSLIEILHPQEATAAPPPPLPPQPPPPPPPPLPPAPSRPSYPSFEELNICGGGESGGDGGPESRMTSSSEVVDLAKFEFKWGRTGRRGTGDKDERYKPVVHESAVGYKSRPSLKKLLYEFYGWDEVADAKTSSPSAAAKVSTDADDEKNYEDEADRVNYVAWYKFLNP